MMTRKAVLEYVKTQYNIEPDYPWRRNPNYAILRHGGGRKWFGAIVDITEDKLGLNGNKLVDALLLKCDPLLISSLRGEPGIYPAYHMNKEHWVSILLSSQIPKERVSWLIDMSYQLTMRASKKENEERVGSGW